MAPAASESDEERTVVASARDRTWLQPGNKILNETYVIERLLGKGGMGEVYQAEHIELGSKRAIKIITPEFAQNSQYVGLFIEEARKLSRVNNDAIVRYYEFSRGEGGSRYLVMEYVDGVSLADLLTGRRLEPREVLELLHRVGQGLAAAYDHGVKAHRDISPVNILLPEARVDLAKVIDFGIAKSADPAGGTLIGSDFAGKFSFVSPEQAGLFGGQEEVNERSDIYSLGLVLAAAAIGFGKRLDMGSEPVSVIRARQSVPDLGRIAAELHPLLTRMLQPHPQDRPPSMRVLAAEAETLLRGPTGNASAPVSRPTGPRTKRRWILPAGIAALGLIAAAAAVVLWPRPESPPQIAEKPAQASVAPRIAEKWPAQASVAPPVADKPPAPASVTPPPVSAMQNPPLQPAAPEPAPTPVSPPPSQAALTPPPPAKLTPPEDQLAAALAHLDCASVRATVAADGKPLITGSVSTTADQAKLQAIAARLSESERPRFDLEIVPPPVCEVLAQFGEWQTAGFVAVGGIGARLPRGAEALHENDPIAVDVTSPLGSPLFNLRLDYFTLGGQVLHMWPNSDIASVTIAGGATQEFLKSGQGNKVWRIGGAPFGVELISVTATRTPLEFGRELPTVELASDYLDELKRALRQAEVARSEPPLIATVPVHTAEK